MVAKAAVLVALIALIATNASAQVCKKGYIPRQTAAGEGVCVARGALILQPDAAARAPAQRAATAVQAEPATPIQLAPPQSRPPPDSAPAGASDIKRGFDDAGEPYVDYTLTDGSVRREQAKGVTITKPDGTSQFYVGPQLENAQSPTPPSLPDDPSLGRTWVSQHNDDLLNLISALVRGDESEMQKFHAGEDNAPGTSTLFGQIEYRMRILGLLAKP